MSRGGECPWGGATSMSAGNMSTSEESRLWKGSVHGGTTSMGMGSLHLALSLSRNPLRSPHVPVFPPSAASLSIPTPSLHFLSRELMITVTLLMGPSSFVVQPHAEVSTVFLGVYSAAPPLLLESTSSVHWIVKSLFSETRC
jgi:hypothetical protein